MTPSANTLKNETRFDLGKWTALARATWILIAFVSVCFYIVSTWTYYQILFVEPFLGSTVAPNVVDLESVRLGLERMGLSIGAYATILVSGQVLITIVCCLLGILIFWKRPTERVAWLMSLILVLIGTQVPVQAYTLAKFYPALGFVGTMTNQIGTIVNLVLIWIFPNGRFVPPWSKWTFFLTMVLGVFGLFFRNLPYGSFLVPLALVLVGSGLLAQFYRYRYVSNPVERQQTKWVLLALLVAPMAWVVSGLILPAMFPSLTATSGNAALYNLVRLTINNFANLLIPLAIGLSILRYRLWDLDLLIRRTLVYSALTATLLVLYFASVVALQELFQIITGQHQSSIATVLSTLAIAALFNPLRKRIQEGIDRRFFRRKYDAQKTVEIFAATLRDEVDLDQLSNHLVLVVEETMQPESVSLWLRGSK